MRSTMIAVGRHGAVAMLCLSLLNACMTPPPAPVADRPQPPTTRINHHVVSRGDTLHTIAWRYELDYQEIAALNGLQPPYNLQSGQRLRLGDTPITVPAGPARAVAVTTTPISTEPFSVEPSGQESYPSGSGSGSGSSLEWIPDTGDAPVDEPADLPGADSSPDTAQSDFPAGSPSATPPTASLPPQSLPPAPLPQATPQSGAWQWPVTGTITREYDAARVFKGINIHSSQGAPVKAAGGGTVVYAGSGLRGYGQLIILKHDDTYLSAYAHNSKILIAENDSVSQGQTIGEVGGDPSDPGRLYFEIREHGKPVDPEKLLPAR